MVKISMAKVESSVPAYPLISSFPDIARISPRGDFKNGGAGFGEKRDKLVEWGVAGKGRAVVAKRPARVVDVASEEIWGHALEQLRMIKQTEVVLDLSMAEIVPVTGMGGGKALQEQVELAVQWSGLVMLAVFQPELYSCFASVANDLSEAVEDQSVVDFRGLFPRFEGVELGFDVRIGKHALGFECLPKDSGQIQ